MNTIAERHPHHFLPTTTTIPISTSDTLISWSVSDAGWRWYDPVTGRWLSNDPIGISGGLNQYVPLGNDPADNSDPFGLKIRVEGSREFVRLVNSQLSELKGIDPRLSRLIWGLEFSDNTHTISRPVPRRGSHVSPGEAGGLGRSTRVCYDSDDCTGEMDEPRDPIAVLAHELSHARDFDLDIKSAGKVAGSGHYMIPCEEIQAVRYENLVRQNAGNALRTTYGTYFGWEGDELVRKPNYIPEGMHTW